jgi:hypothetical protein
MSDPTVVDFLMMRCNDGQKLPPFRPCKDIYCTPSGLVEEVVLDKV